MPLEIRELVIKAKISNANTTTSPPLSVANQEQTALIAACVEQVLTILKEKAER